MARGMFKPIKFLFTEPIVQVFALYMAVLYGVLYLSLTSEPFYVPESVFCELMITFQLLFKFSLTNTMKIRV